MNKSIKLTINTLIFDPSNPRNTVTLSLNAVQNVTVWWLFGKLHRVSTYYN